VPPTLEWSPDGGTGAERLEGRGDFLAVVEGRFGRVQAAYATEREIRHALGMGVDRWEEDMRGL